jgi:PKD repeat protein
MKANKLIPRMWILISVLFTIHNFAQKNIVGYEYAFNDGEGLQYTAIAPTPNYNLVTDIDVSGLTSDINVFNIRFKDSDGLWSAIISSIFITPPVPDNVDTKIVGYEYAFNDGEGLQYVPITPSQDFNLITDIDVSSLPHDINVFHIRFKADDGKWSSMISHIFIRPPETSNIETNIVGYEYGFNEGESLQFVPVTPSQNFNLITDVDVSALPHDINVFHIRFKADDGKWSSMISHIFIRPPEITTANANIIGYEYAFNDNSNVQFTSIAPTKDYNLVVNLDASTLTSNINTFYIRFLDDTGKWSSMLHHLFIRPPEPLVYADNKIVAYDYWFDHDESTKVTVDVETPTADLLVAEVDMSQLWAGEHQIHTQFKDAYNNYSLVMTDTIDKQVLPIAAFVSNLNSICVGETINFTNNSIDYDVVAWDFDDGNSSTDFNTTHTFNTAGTFEVTLTVSESNSGLDSIATQSIQVYSIPANTITASGSLEACFGSTVTLTADDADADYLWSTGATSRSIDVTTNGTYNVTLTRTNSSGCSVVSNDMVVTFDPEIDNSVTIDENVGYVLLTANQVGATYQWIDCSNGNINIDGETSQTFTPTINGEYAVNVSVNNCSVTSDCQSITSLDINDFSIYNFVKLYPNPVKDILTVKTEIPLLIQLCNINGMIINTLKLERGVNYIDLKILNSGLYFLKIKESSDTGNQRQGVFKVIKT